MNRTTTTENLMDLDLFDAPQCESEWTGSTSSGEHDARCELADGHSGPHRDDHGCEWSERYS